MADQAMNPSTTAPTPNDMPGLRGFEPTQSELLNKASTPYGPGRPIVVLVGAPGAGKTTIGRRLSRALNTHFRDTDQLIEAEAGKPCGEVFSELGEPAFRELEEKVVEKALHGTGVLSLGGGAVTSESTRKLLKDQDVVWIDVSVEEGVRRTRHDNSRPVLNGEDPVARYKQLLDQRRPLYREVSNFRARTDRRSPQKVVGDILSYIEVGTPHSERKL